MQLIKLLENIKFKSIGNLDKDITSVVYDSRKVQKGSIFICLRGAKSDGHNYIDSVIRAGAAAVVVEKPVKNVSCAVITVNNTKSVLAKISANWFGNPASKLKVIGITGTKGKTTSSYMIHSILESAGIKTGIIGTIGTVIGNKTYATQNTTPASYEIQKSMSEMVKFGCKACVIEASSIGLREYRVSGFTFDIGLFTNFSADHIGGVEHKDMEEYASCKSMLFKQCKHGIVNIDDENLEKIIKDHTCTLSTYGFSEKAELRATDAKLISKDGFLGVNFNLSGELNFSVDVDIPGKFSVYNALGAISVCHFLGANEEAIKKGLISVKVKGRVEPVPVDGDYTLLLDYAHNAVSMENILTTLREYNPNRLICMFGAGGNRPKIRRYEMGEMSGKLADLSVITADNSRDEDVMDIIEDIKTGMAKTSGKFIVIPDRKLAIRWCMENAQKGDVVVLAGKGHEDYQEIKGVKYHFDEREIIADIIASHMENKNI